VPVYFFEKNMKAILGKKIEMSQVFDGKGNVVPVTFIEAGPCKVLRMKTKEKEGYEALQLGFEAKGKTFRHIKEFRNIQGMPDEDILASVFQEGEKVKVSGISKGKGFQGGVKRHGFHGRNATHGVKHEHRTLGSTGSRWPQHVRKGKKMPGRMGADRVSVRNLPIMKIDLERNLIAVKGAVPGARGTLLEIRSEA